MGTVADREKYPYHRKYIRHRVRVKIEVEGDRSFNAWTINLSQDGLCFEIPEQVDVGRRVGVWIFLTRGKKKDPPVRATASVVWYDRGKKDFRHGGQFVDFEDDGRQRLAKWLADGASRL
jgi:hypothetical protein